MRRLWILGIVATLSCVALPVQRARQEVPEVAPDSEPAWLYADSAQSESGYWMHVVLVLFHASASRVQRQAAVDCIGGSVIGGMRGIGPDGFYIVYLPQAETSIALGDAIARLKSLPQVELASLAWTGNATFGPIRIRGDP